MVRSLAPEQPKRQRTAPGLDRKLGLVAVACDGAHADALDINHVLLHHVAARVADFPVEIHAGRLQHPAGGLRELRAGAVARDEDHAVGHGAGL